MSHNTLTVAGIDISLSNLGLVKFEFEIPKMDRTYTYKDLYAVDERLITTKPLQKKDRKRSYKNDEDFFRARSLYEGFVEFVDDCDIGFIELPVGSQGARAMASYGISIGIASAVRNCELITVSNDAVKIASGVRNASKQQMIDWATRKFPDVRWLRERNKKDGNIVKANEHMADACGAVIAGINTREFRQLVAVSARMSNKLRRVA